MTLLKMELDDKFLIREFCFLRTKKIWFLLTRDFTGKSGFRHSTLKMGCEIRHFFEFRWSSGRLLSLRLKKEKK